ncbi:hypothetical protein GCM10009799_24950 [Nocardiopsis rhodophaea]|uniref:Serine/threonine protein kinase n=1 Tax=Nocardiopsis rhodophaea TaxID=280238 RepID=A0ABN2T2Z6_9ACTN
MPVPLQQTDPRQLGAYRLSHRLSHGAEGVVYLAHDRDGQPVSVAMLSEGAAADPAARDRFAAAVTQGAGLAGAPRVLASNTTNPAASWVAAPYTPDRAGAEAFLAPVAVGAEEHGPGAPGYAPHWATRSTPAAVRWSGAADRDGASATEATTDRRVVLGLLLVLLLFVALLILLYLWLTGLSSQAGGADGEPFPSGGSPSSEEPSTTPRPTYEPWVTPDPRGTWQPTDDPSPTSDVPTVDVEDDDSSGLPPDPRGWG